MSVPKPSFDLLSCGAEAAQVLAELHAEIFAGGEVWNAQAFSEIFSIPGTQAYLACDGDVPLGLILYRVIAGEVEILTIGTVTSARRRGVASGLVKAVQKYGTIFLEVSVQNQSALSLYSNLGFTVIGRRKRYYRDGSDASVLSL
ncbi:GNAT family N-acetyltransferase [Neokomagataea tanensis]|uniref:GNAT family N-acetyltransferase n=1 Tax=Neokomagataea tanensis TaxID=661191 RepID=A0A4Y6V2Y8_9PROT|nr:MULTISPECIES: GNAT family N-acetyltransferase [Neokomagataea]QDH24432.1 GNAT family N-acetyltransferase [Neokomagataea tanensis]